MKIEQNAINATLVMVDLLAHRPGHGDQSECILLQMKITQLERLVQFSVRKLVSKIMAYTLLHRENAITMSERQFYVDRDSCK